MAHSNLPLSGFLTQLCLSLPAYKLEIRLTSSCVGEIDK